MNITHHKNGEIKTLVDEAPYHPGYEDAGFKPKAVNNKPVAWMREDGTLKFEEGLNFEVGQPFYTHPVKELTDEEIAEIYHSENRFSPKGNFAYYGFARAILRKAQEK